MMKTTIILTTILAFLCFAVVLTGTEKEQKQTVEKMRIKGVVKAIDTEHNTVTVQTTDKKEMTYRFHKKVKITDRKKQSLMISSKPISNLKKGQKIALEIYQDEVTEVVVEAEDNKTPAQEKDELKPKSDKKTVQEKTTEEGEPDGE